MSSFLPHIPQFPQQGFLQPVAANLRADPHVGHYIGWKTVINRYRVVFFRDLLKHALGIMVDKYGLHVPC